jgi:hypothetical protein
MTEQELQELCEKWQERLSLRDWRVTVRLVDLNIIGTESVGTSSWLLPLKTATITILDKRFIPDDSLERDMEETLVHELLHIHFARWSDETYLKDNEYGTPLEGEQGIDAISRALVALDRDIKKYAVFASIHTCDDVSPLAEITI